MSSLIRQNALSVLEWKSLLEPSALVRQNALSVSEWKEIMEEEQDEIEFAQEHLDPVYWCWNCKYSDCDRH